MPKKMSLIQKVIKARIDFLNQKIKKTGRNEFAKFDYFELEDIVPPALRICKSLNILPVTSFTDGKAIMTIYDADSLDTLVIESPMAGADLKGCHDVQNLGASETYLRRYLWNAFLEITEHDELDGTSGAGKPTSPPAAKKNANSTKVATAKQEFSPQKVWTDICKHLGYSVDLSQKEKEEITADAKDILKMFGITELKQIDSEISQEIYDYLARDNSQAKGPESFEDSSKELEDMEPRKR